MIIEDMSNEFLVMLLQTDLDPEIFETVVYRFLPMYVKCLSKYRIQRFDLDDYIQEGRIALYTAIQKYELTRESYFAPYFQTIYQNQISNIARKQRAQRRGGNQPELSLLVKTKDQEFDILETIEDNKFIKPSDSLYLKERSEVYLSSLSKLEREVLQYYMMGYSKVDITQCLDLTKTQVQSAIDRCRKKMYKYMAEVDDSQDA